MSYLLCAAQPQHRPALTTLLQAANLPTDDLPTDLSGFVLAFDDATLVGSAGVESFGNVALLRSVAVSPDHQRYGLARQLLDAVTESARQRSVSALYLITETADGYFAKHGFIRVERSAVPAPVAATRQFSELCPASSIVMMRGL